MVSRYFLETCYKEDTIDPLPLPGYTCETGLKYTKVELENIQEVDISLIFENATRGELSGWMGKDSFCKRDINACYRL